MSTIRYKYSMKHTKDSLIDQIATFYTNHNKIPSSNDYKRFPGEIYPHSVYKGYFGSFNNALIAAGLPVFDRTPAVKNCKECNMRLPKSSRNIFCSKSCAGTHNNRPKVKRKCLHCDNDLMRRGTAVTYCSKDCKNAAALIKSDANIEAGLSSSSVILKKYLTRKRGYKCEWCDVSEWRNEPITLECDHIDGNPDNNLPNNLRLLCPNCHSQTPTFRSYNRGKHKSDKRSVLRRKRYADA